MLDWGELLVFDNLTTQTGGPRGSLRPDRTNILQMTRADVGVFSVNSD